ncbi:hypothetical protein SAMN05216226_108111 [Halovenus aranensis]|uniref:DUF447 family protein n=1 Tax=Halovenus aranensis TaxID=890420 RepID=A0A1G8W8J5_9EURY|nr:DUF447 domain-containing protein [Halovenus aranensis]SDJ74055.1 hypothetical protein SAMN05216226_108111 [Halovenus aranensis]
MTATGWPVELRGVTESIIATLGPNDRYNFAALGLHAPAEGIDPGSAETVRARTWGRTRTWRNFTERGGGVVQFSRDPVLFTDAALDIYEQDDPVHESAAAWVTVSVERTDEGTDGETQWVDWELTPEDATAEYETFPAFNRGYAAVVEATVAASRLDVEAYDTETLVERIEYFGEVVERCGGPREREAFGRIEAIVDEL